jgi:hypothetical protein
MAFGEQSNEQFFEHLLLADDHFRGLGFKQFYKSTFEVDLMVEGLQV